MTVEVILPDAWSPPLALATAQLLQHTVRDGFPVITAIRADATPDQLSDICARVQLLIEESGLAV
jgi:hypothetical protein